MLSALAKFFVGFFTGIMLLIGGSVVIAYFFLARLSSPPPKPIFAEEQIKKSTASVSKTKPVATTSSSKPKTTTQPTPKPTPSETPKPKPEPGLYQARITWNGGLSLRDKPTTDSSRVGRVGFNENVRVLEESADKKWLRVKLENSTEEGWIKAGNIDRVDPKKPTESTSTQSTPKKQR